MRTAEMTRTHIVLSKTEQARVTKMAQGRGWSVSAVGAPGPVAFR